MTKFALFYAVIALTIIIINVFTIELVQAENRNRSEAAWYGFFDGALTILLIVLLFMVGGWL